MSECKRIMQAKMRRGRSRKNEIVIPKNVLRKMVQSATKKYLKKGGKINTIVAPSYEEFMKYRPDPSNADTFLKGTYGI